MGILERIKNRLDQATGSETGGGSLGFHGLTGWFEATFTDEERELIEQRYQPFGLDRDRPLTQGNIAATSSSATHLLSHLASWFNKPGERHLARRILDKAEQVAEEEDAAVLDRHFLYQHKLDVNYPERDDPEAMAAAVRACEQQIAISRQAAEAFRDEYPDQPLPAHRGFKQLAIIYDKQGRQQEAIELCRRAQTEGWNGDWDRRIERLQSKLDKT